MADSDSNSGSCRLQVWAAQSVVPAKPTLSRISSKLPLSLHGGSAISTAAFHVVLLFPKSAAGNSGWLHASLIKESLGTALVDQPILAGRIRPRDDDESVLEIVANDSGIRMVETTANVTAAEFLAGGENEVSKLVFWEDIPGQLFQFHPLFSLQVTNFTCGGYSIGFSCSLLLIDPFAATSFLKEWINIHKNFLANNDEANFPLFYHLRFKGHPATSLVQLTTRKPMTYTVLFTIVSDACVGLDYKDIVEVCVQEAEQEVDRKMMDEFGVMIKRSPKSDGTEVVMMLRSESRKICADGFSMKMARTWDEFRFGDVWFGEQEKVEYASCWMSNSPTSDEGFVIIYYGCDATKVLVLFP